MATLSGFPSMAPAQEEDSKTGHCTLTLSLSKDAWRFDRKDRGLARALRNLVRLTLLPGPRRDGVEVEPLTEDIAFDALPGGKAFDYNRLRAGSDKHGANTVIPPEGEGLARFLAVSKCANGALSSKITSAISENSAASTHAAEKPAGACRPDPSRRFPVRSQMNDNGKFRRTRTPMARRKSRFKPSCLP